MHRVPACLVDEPHGPFLNLSARDCASYAARIKFRQSSVYLTANNVAFIRSLNANPSDIAEPTPKHHSAINQSQPGSFRVAPVDAVRAL